MLALSPHAVNVHVSREVGSWRHSPPVFNVDTDDNGGARAGSQGRFATARVMVHTQREPVLPAAKGSNVAAKFDGGRRADGNQAASCHRRSCTEQLMELGSDNNMPRFGAYRVRLQPSPLDL